MVGKDAQSSSAQADAPSRNLRSKSMGATASRHEALPGTNHPAPGSDVEEQASRLLPKGQFAKRNHPEEDDYLGLEVSDLREMIKANMRAIIGKPSGSTAPDFEVITPHGPAGRYAGVYMFDWKARRSGTDAGIQLLDAEGPKGTIHDALVALLLHTDDTRKNPLAVPKNVVSMALNKEQGTQAQTSRAFTWRQDLGQFVRAENDGQSSAPVAQVASSVTAAQPGNSAEKRASPPKTTSGRPARTIKKTRKAMSRSASLEQKAPVTRSRASKAKSTKSPTRAGGVTKSKKA